MSREVCIYELYTAFSFSFLFSFSTLCRHSFYIVYFSSAFHASSSLAASFIIFVFLRFPRKNPLYSTLSSRRRREWNYGTRCGNGLRVARVMKREQDGKRRTRRATCGERRRVGRFYSKQRRFIERCTHSRCYTFTALPRGACTPTI